MRQPSERQAQLFRYERDGETYNLTSDLLNDHLGEHMGNGFTGRTIDDFRSKGRSRSGSLRLDKAALMRMLRA